MTDNKIAANRPIFVKC